MRIGGHDRFPARLARHAPKPFAPKGRRGPVRRPLRRGRGCAGGSLHVAGGKAEGERENARDTRDYSGLVRAHDGSRGNVCTRRKRRLQELRETKHAGVAGFEPTHGGVKVRCLTAWLHPIGAGSSARLLHRKRNGQPVERGALSEPRTALTVSERRSAVWRRRSAMPSTNRKACLPSRRDSSWRGRIRPCPRYMPTCETPP